MIYKSHISCCSLCVMCFKFLPNPLNKWRRDFTKDVVWPFLSINAHVNFLQLGRYGQYVEQRYRQHFEVDFVFFNFNTTLVGQYCRTRRAKAFDPSYIPKSVRKTEGVRWFWSGCAYQSKWGLEIGGLAVLDFVGQSHSPSFRSYSNHSI